MKTLCCKCSANLEAIDGVGFSYCDRCVKVAQLEMDVEKAETAKRRTRGRLNDVKWRFADRRDLSCTEELQYAQREAEFEHWEDRVSELRLRISELGA